MSKKCLYLVSSSASREYVADCVESLALPRGMVQHFRYRFKYIDESLRKSLPSEAGEMPASLRDLPVVVVYLYQEQTVGVWKPVEAVGHGAPYLPLRCGRLLRAFKDGEIAHFFFELTNYVSPKYRRSFTRLKLNDSIKFQIAPSKPPRTSYAHLSKDLGFSASRLADTVAFQGIVDDAYVPGEWRTRSLGSAPLDVTYDIVFFRIAGLFRQKGTHVVELAPVQRLLRSNVLAEYVLESGVTYHIRLATHLSARLPAQLPGAGQAMLKLLFDPDVIRTEGPSNLKLTSLYDLEYWSFVTKSPESIRSVLSVTCEHNPPPNRDDFVRKELLFPEISLPRSVVVPNSTTTPDSHEANKTTN